MADGKVEYEIRGDMSKLDTDLSNANKKIVKSAEETAEKQEKAQKGVEKTVKASNDSIVKDTQQSQKEIEKTVKSTNDAIEDDSEDMQKELTNAMKELTEVIKEESSKASEYFGKMAQDGKKSGYDIEQSFSEMAESAVSKIGKLASAMSALKFASDFTKTAITEAKNNETAFAKVNTLLADGTDTDSYYNSIRNASLNTGVDFGSISESVYGAISASVDQESAVDFVQTAVKLAKGGFTETATAVDVLTTAINAYGLEASEATRLSDILITTQNLGKTTVDELASSMGQTIPIANNAGVAIDDLATQYAIMTKNGVATAESGTQIKAMLNELSSSGTKVSDTLKEISGKSFAELQAEGKNTAEILNMLSDHAEKSGVKLSDLFGSVEAGAAAITLVKDGGKDFCDVLNQMGNSAGAAEKAYETMANTTEERFNKLQNSLMLYVSEVGEKMLPAIEDFFEYLEEHSEEIGEIITGVGSVLSTLLKIILQAVEVAWKYRDVLVALAAAFAISKVIKVFSGVIDTSTRKIKLNTTALKENLSALRNNSDAAGKTGSSFKELLSSINPTALAVSAFAVAVSKVLSKMQELNAVTDEYNSKIESIQNNANDTISSVEAENAMLEKKVERYESLRTAAELTATEEAELKSIASELQDVFGNDIIVIDKVTGKYNDLSDAVKNYTQQRLKIAERDAAYTQLEEYYAERTRLQNEIAEISKNFNSEDYAWAASYASNPDYLNIASTAVLSLTGNPFWGTNASPEDWLAYRQNRDALDDLMKKIAQLEQQCGVLDQAFYSNTNATNENTDATDENTKSKDDNTESTNNQSDSYKDLQSALTDTKTKYDLLNSAQEEFNSTGSLSVSTLQSIINTYPALQDKVEQYLAGLIDERELLAAMTDAYDVDQQNYYKYLLVKLGYQEDFVKAAFDGEDAVVEYFAEKYGIDLKNYANYLEAKNALQQKYDEVRAKYGDEIMEAFKSGNTYYAKALMIGRDKELASIQSAMEDLENFYNPSSTFQTDFASIKERTYETLSSGSSSRSSSGSSSSSKSSGGSSSSNKPSGSSSASSGKSSSSAGGSNGGQTINITSYIPTVWDEAARANEKLIAGGVAASLVGNSTSGKLITGLDSNGAAALNAHAETTDATLNDVVRAIKGLEKTTSDMQITVTALLKCDSVTLARQTIKGVKAIEKSTGKSPW